MSALTTACPCCWCPDTDGAHCAACTACRPGVLACAAPAARIGAVARIGYATLRAALAPSPAEEAAAGARVWARLCAGDPTLDPTRRGSPQNEVA